MKKGFIEFVYSCLSCQKSKIEHQKSSRLMQPLGIPESSGLMHPLSIPEWEWEKNSMDLITSFPKTSKGSDPIWVVGDRLINQLMYFKKD